MLPSLRQSFVSWQPGRTFCILNFVRESYAWYNSIRDRSCQRR
ncbi:hypothetical protein M5D96_012322 [Drosophila gunungcola]|uniref:Uncharacterized protein n=1 Tax=Drosophila gunungcola TaxID=103775 RepID=A0A9P9YE79_9MUSC|nr:hypothetical protein M5D96_012322 [Drosophila gunungcola]